MEPSNGTFLLLDEADVFLELFSLHDAHRNALVSVFIRELEYYKGIMFLTTNRVNQMDNAIASRIHLPLKYKSLGLDARGDIWESFLNKAVTNKKKGAEGGVLQSQGTKWSPSKCLGELFLGLSY